MALTDDELLELAKKDIEETEDLHDVWYYQQSHCIFDGNYAILTNHLYFHYKNWSINPISLDIFIDFIKLNTKNKNFLLIDKNKCSIIVEKLIGDYVKNQRQIQKEKRFRKISSSKS
jgi:hypothetical protein